MFSLYLLWNCVKITSLNFKKNRIEKNSMLTTWLSLSITFHPLSIDQQLNLRYLRCCWCDSKAVSVDEEGKKIHDTLHWSKSISFIEVASIVCSPECLVSASFRFVLNIYQHSKSFKCFCLVVPPHSLVETVKSTIKIRIFRRQKFPSTVFVTFWK